MNVMCYFLLLRWGTDKFVNHYLLQRLCAQLTEFTKTVKVAVKANLFLFN